MLLSQSTDEWQAGLEKFIDTIFEGTYASETAPRPCSSMFKVPWSRVQNKIRGSNALCV
jgi:hypothetical protein